MLFEPSTSGFESDDSKSFGASSLIHDRPVSVILVVYFGYYGPSTLVKSHPFKMWPKNDRIHPYLLPLATSTFFYKSDWKYFKLSRLILVEWNASGHDNKTTSSKTLHFPDYCGGWNLYKASFQILQLLLDATNNLIWCIIT